MLPVAEQIGDGHAPFELLIVGVTDQGKRRPTRVVRLVPPGSRVAVAELVARKLSWCKNDKFALSGLDALTRERATVHASQTWLCQLAAPSGGAFFKVWASHQEGIEISRSRVLGTAPNHNASSIVVASVLHKQLGLRTMQALVTRDSRTHLALLDCELEWMAEERFCLGGLQLYPEGEHGAARLLRQGWLCEPHVPRDPPCRVGACAAQDVPAPTFGDDQTPHRLYIIGWVEQGQKALAELFQCARCHALRVLRQRYPDVVKAGDLVKDSMISAVAFCLGQ